MALVAWILAVFGAGLAFALCAGSASRLVRRIDRTSAMAVMPLPALAMYLTMVSTYGKEQPEWAMREVSELRLKIRRGQVVTNS